MRAFAAFLFMVVLFASGCASPYTQQQIDTVLTEHDRLSKLSRSELIDELNEKFVGKCLYGDIFVCNTKIMSIDQKQGFFVYKNYTGLGYHMKKGMWPFVAKPVPVDINGVTIKTDFLDQAILVDDVAQGQLLYSYLYYIHMSYSPKEYQRLIRHYRKTFSRKRN